MNSQARLYKVLHRKTPNDTLKTCMHHMTTKTTCSQPSDSITLVRRKKIEYGLHLSGILSVTELGNCAREVGYRTEPEPEGIWEGTRG